MFKRGVDRDNVAQQYRRDEFHFFDSDRGTGTLCDTPSQYAAGLIHHTKHPATKDVAIGIDIRWPGNDA
jgi:hypothetical protein